MSKEFEKLCGGVRTRKLAKLIDDKVTGKDVRKRAEGILKECGIKPKDDNKSDMLVYTTHEAIHKMANFLQNGDEKTDKELAEEFGKLISKQVAVPDMALSGRMLETGVLKDTTVDAALQAAHAISTHEARPEVDYYVAADDIPGEDAGAGFVDEAMFASACFYKYFSIDWKQLVNNLKGYGQDHEKLAAHTVGAFLRGAAQVNPTGKQNSYAAHNPPDGILVEIQKNGGSPISYANAFAKPVNIDDRDLISQSIANLGNYVHHMDVGYGRHTERFWFSPGLSYHLNAVVEDKENEKVNKREIPLTNTKNNIKSIEELISAVVEAIGYDWEEVKKVIVNTEVA